MGEILTIASISFILNVLVGVIVALISIKLSEYCREKSEFRRIASMLKTELNENLQKIEENIKLLDMDLQRIQSGQQSALLSLINLRTDAWSFFKSSILISSVNERVLEDLCSLYTLIDLVNNFINSLHNLQMFRVGLPKYLDQKLNVEQALMHNLQELKNRIELTKGKVTVETLKRKG